MVEIAGIGQTLSNTFGGIIGGLTVTIIVLVIIGLFVGLGWFIHYRRKFDVMVEISSQRADNTFSCYYDKAAILIDRKTGAKFLKLWETKVELPVPPFNVMEKTNKGDLIRMWRKTADEFVFLTNQRINKNVIIKEDGRYYQIADNEYMPLESDVAFWNLKRKQTNRDIFSNDSILSKIMMWMPQIIGGVLTIMILYVLFNSLPVLIDKLSILADRLVISEAIQNASR